MDKKEKVELILEQVRYLSTDFILAALFELSVHGTE